MFELSIWRQNFLLILFVFALSLAILAPMGSDEFMPDLINVDARNHVGIIVMAKEALDEGQMPVRVSRTEHHGLRYPLFQFYSPFYYTLAGSIYKWVTPSNPYITLKIMLMMGMMIGGLFAYRCANKITGRPSISFLAAALYMCAPYTLITIHFRAACPENFAMGLIPVIVFYTLGLFDNDNRLKTTLLLGLAWSILLLTHTITFFYTAVFSSFLMMVYCAYTKQYQPMFYMFRAFFVTFLLCFWYIAPMFIIKPLLFISGYIYNPYVYRELTLLSGLFSFSMVAPTPAPGPIFYPPFGTLSLFPIYASLGIPTLCTIGYAIYCLFTTLPHEFRVRVACLLLTFLMALLLMWLPIDVYSLLPSIFQMAQFPYRLLAQTQWIGWLIFILVFNWAYINKSVTASTVIIFLALIILSCASWIPTHGNGNKSIHDVVTNPKIVYADEAYLLTLDSVTTYMPEKIEEGELGKNCSIKKGVIQCMVNVKPGVDALRLPILYYPQLLNITVDGQKVEYYPAFGAEGSKVALLAVTEGTHFVSASFVGYQDANLISLLVFLGVLIALINLQFFHRRTK